MKAALPLLVLLSTGLAHAGVDYAPGSTDWNGLQRLLEVSKEAGCDMVAEDELDWSALQATDVLWFVYPRAQVDGQKMKDWVASGGRVVIADDFGAAAPALARLNLQRGVAPAPGQVARYQANPNLPVAHGDPRYDLGRATPELVANHPATLRSPLPPAYAFAPGAALVVEGRVGKGSFVAIADPSVLINNMLEIDGNRAFAAALVARTCRAGRDRIHLFTQTFTAHGSPPRAAVEPPDPASGAAHFNQALDRANGSLKSLLTDGRNQPWLGAFVSVLALFILIGAFPARATVRDRWTRVGRLAEDAPAPSPLGWDYGGPAGVLREEVLERLERALGPVDFDRVGPQALAQQVEMRFGAEAGGRARELWRRLHQIRWRTVDGEVMPTERVSRRGLQQLHKLAVALFGDLEG